MRCREADVREEHVTLHQLTTMPTKFSSESLLSRHCLVSLSRSSPSGVFRRMSIGSNEVESGAKRPVLMKRMKVDIGLDLACCFDSVCQKHETIIQDTMRTGKISTLAARFRERLVRTMGVVLPVLLGEEDIAGCCYLLAAHKLKGIKR